MPPSTTFLLYISPPISLFLQEKRRNYRQTDRRRFFWQKIILDKFSTSGAAQAEFVLINATSQWLTLYIDGRKSVSVPPGDRGVDLITVGNHTFRAVTPDGRYATHQGYVPPEGKTWTVTEK
jgi:hypothetical protein